MANKVDVQADGSTQSDPVNLLRNEFATCDIYLRVIIRILFVSALMLSSIACSNPYEGYENPSSSTPVTLAKGSMSASINGVSWNADDSVEARNSPPNYLSVSASDKHAWTVNFYLNNFVVGTQSIGAKAGNCYLGNQSGNFDGGQSGTVTITSFTATGVAGTFDCGTLQRSDDGGGSKTATVINGKFDVKF